MVGLQAARGRRRRHRNRRPMSRTQLNIINTRVSSPLQVNTRKFHRTKTAKAFSLVHRERPSHCITRRCYPSSSCPNRLPGCAHVRHTPDTERKKRQGGGGKKQKNTKGRRGEGQQAFGTYTFVAQATGQTGRPGGLVDTSPSSSSKVTRFESLSGKTRIPRWNAIKARILRPR